jgi:hypothetical protein
MKIGVRFKIDVTKIDKALLFKGEKGIYLDCTTFLELDQADQYGNHGFISQDIPKERRDAGEKGTILGNGKIFYRDGETSQSGQQGGHQQPDEDIPF